MRKDVDIQIAAVGVGAPRRTVRIGCHGGLLLWFLAFPPVVSALSRAFIIGHGDREGSWCHGDRQERWQVFGNGEMMMPTTVKRQLQNI
jgi:hypothetical protein